MLDILNPYIKTKVDVLRQRPGGQIIDALDWAIEGGADKWGNDITYDANKTLYRPFILADAFTVNAGKTLTLSQSMPLIVVADIITINGTIEASGKGCSRAGYRCNPTTYPLFGFFAEEVSGTRNYCFCGAGGGSASSAGGGAFGTGIIGTGPSCTLTDAEIEQSLFNPFFNIFQIGLGGGGHGSSFSGEGGGSILLLGRLIILGAASSILANGVDAASGNNGGGGGGFVGLAGDTITDNGATLVANGGALSGSGYAGGAGKVVKIEV